MDTPPSSEGGVSRGDGTGAVGGSSNVDDSFHEIPEPPRHELLLLLRVEQKDGRPHRGCGVDYRTRGRPRSILRINDEGRTLRGNDDM